MKRKIIFFSWLLLSAAGPIPGAAQTVKGGFTDLSHHDFVKDGAVVLSGTWEFYWSQLLSPSDVNAGLKMHYLNVPGSWHRQGDFDVLGFGTYRLRMIIPDDRSGLSIYFPIINSSAKIWVNNNLVQETGKVSGSPLDFTPKLLATIVALPQNTREIELVVQVANFAYFSGGIAGYPRLDRSPAIFAKLSRDHGIENIFAGSLFAMFIYQLILYLLYHRGKPYLWLALICLGVALRALIVHGGSFMLPNLYPSVEWELWKKIEFGSVYAVIALFPLYVKDLFLDHAPKLPVLIFVFVAVVFCAAVIVTPQFVYGKLLEFCHLFLLLGFIYAVYSITRAWRAGNKDARIILLGVLAAFPFVLGEIMKNSRFFSIDINFMYLVELGVLVFLLFQVYLLAHHYAKSYRNLETMNQDLERIVQLRTRELTTANTVKDRLLSVMSHDIKSPLNSLRGILEIYNKGAISKDEFNHFARNIESDLGKTSMLVENILFWTASQLKGIQIKSEKFNLYTVIDQNVQLFHTLASLKKITIRHNASQNTIIKGDPNILNLVLRNLLSNAIKFSFENGIIEIFVHVGDTLSIEVRDAGIGMDEAKLEALLEPVLVSETGTGNEQGTGLGLSLCREYLRKAGGELTVQSSPQAGSTFRITFPLK